MNGLRKLGRVLDYVKGDEYHLTLENYMAGWKKG